jgi:hypothetical protein
MAPLLIPNIKSRPFWEGVTDSEVPGQTRTSPPRGKRTTAVSLAAFTTDGPAIVCVGKLALLTASLGDEPGSNDTFVGCPSAGKVFFAVDASSQTETVLPADTTE